MIEKRSRVAPTVPLFIAAGLAVSSSCGAVEDIAVVTAVVMTLVARAIVKTTPAAANNISLFFRSLTGGATAGALGFLVTGMLVEKRVTMTMLFLVGGLMIGTVLGVVAGAALFPLVVYARRVSSRRADDAREAAMLAAASSSPPAVSSAERSPGRPRAAPRSSACPCSRATFGGSRSSPRSSPGALRAGASSIAPKAIRRCPTTSSGRRAPSSSNASRSSIVMRSKRGSGSSGARSSPSSPPRCRSCAFKRSHRAFLATQRSKRRTGFHHRPHRGASRTSAELR